MVQLPSRLLFENEFIRIVLVGLSRGTDRIRLQPRRPVLVTVTFGRALVRGEGVVRELAEGNQLRLEPGILYRLRPVEVVDLVFFEQIRSGPQGEAAQAANNEKHADGSVPDAAWVTSRA